jgi:hypothetical protein
MLYAVPTELENYLHFLFYKHFVPTELKKFLPRIRRLRRQKLNFSDDGVESFKGANRRLTAVSRCKTFTNCKI